MDQSVLPRQPFVRRGREVAIASAVINCQSVRCGDSLVGGTGFCGSIHDPRACDALGNHINIRSSA